MQRTDYDTSMKQVEEQVQIMDDMKHSQKYTDSSSNMTDFDFNDHQAPIFNVQERLLEEVQKWSRAQNRNLHRSATELLEDMDKHFWMDKNDQSSKAYHLFQELR